MGLTIILTTIAIMIGAAMYALGGGMAFAFYAMTLPVGLFILWLSRDVKSWEEKWAPSSTVERPRSPRALAAEGRA